VITFDFETEAIVGNPIHNPPKPVGVAIQQDRRQPHYLAWGHPTGNNCTFEEGRMALLTNLALDDEWCCHNAAFDMAVLQKWMGVSAPKNWLNLHDTQFLVFLHDPYAFSFGLKQSAERILRVPPDEQEALRDWVMAHVQGATLKTWGAHIAKAPGTLVGQYACGDVARTYALWAKLHPSIVEQGMQAAYQREQLLTPILSESSKRGVRVDLEKLEAAIEKYTAAKEKAEQSIFATLGEFNIDSDRELAERLAAKDQVTEWVLTPTGKRSTARKNLVGRVRDPGLLDALAYRGILATCLGTFAEPWAVAARENAGRLHPQWNQVRGDRGAGGDLSGTRTGRMSCRDPNLQNIPNDFEGVTIPDGLPPLIHMREFLLPEEGHVWVKRDFSAQEMRIMAHFAEGKLFDAFLADPATDPHKTVQQLIKDMLGIDMPRKYVKITGFGIMYGRGIPNLSAALGVPVDEGKAVRDAYFAALPEIKRMSAEIRDIGRRGQPIKTWGGRKYFREPDPTGRDLSYKLFNYLIQGSAADQTKQSLIDWDSARFKDHHLIAAVHDEVNISVPEDQVELGMQALRESMDWLRFDVPFMSEGYTGPNWQDLESYND
jgi:DNA polymerase I